jgi:hypothetical protein
MIIIDIVLVAVKMYSESGASETGEAASVVDIKEEYTDASESEVNESEVPKPDITLEITPELKEEESVDTFEQPKPLKKARKSKTKKIIDQVID